MLRINSHSRFTTIDAVDGKKMISLINEDSGNKKAVIFANGYCTSFYSPNRVQARWSKQLFENGYNILRFDYRGYGESEGRFEDSNVTTQSQDLETVINYASDIWNIDEIIVIGMSLGGLITKNVFDKVSNSKLTKAILLCPALDFSNIYSDDYKFKIKTTLFNYKSDEYTFNFERDLMNYIDTHNFVNKEKQYLVIHGDSDDIIPIDKSIEFAKHDNVKLITLENAEHNLWSSIDDTNHYERSIELQESVIKHIIDYLE